MAWAWEHWDRLHPMSNPAGYLYRVAQTHARRSVGRGRVTTFPSEQPQNDESASSKLDGDLAMALVALPEHQRTAVLLVHLYGWTPGEVAQITGVPSSTTRSHLRRGLRQLRTTLQKDESS